MKHLLCPVLFFALSLSLAAQSNRCITQPKPLRQYVAGCQNTEAVCVCNETGNCGWAYPCGDGNRQSGIDARIPLGIQPGQYIDITEMAIKQEQLKILEQQRQILEQQRQVQPSRTNAVERSANHSGQQAAVGPSNGSQMTGRYLNGRFWRSISPTASVVLR